MKSTFTISSALCRWLLLVFLSTCCISYTFGISVKFSVDMSYQIANGSFHPSAENVYVRGSFNEWGLSNPLQPEGNGVYSATLNLNLQTGYEFKFFTDAPGFSNSGWEQNVGKGKDNRWFSIPSGGDVDLGKVYFNDANLKLRYSDDNYAFYCDDADTQYIAGYIEYMQENIPRIVDMLETTLLSTVKIMIYPDRKSFLLAYGNPVAPDWVGGCAVGHSDLIVLTPRIYSGGQPDPGLIGHEFTHAVVDCKKHSYVHAWLNEGAACFYGGEPGVMLLRFDRQIKQLIETQYNGQMPDLSKIESWDFADNGGYPLATSIADFIITQFGKPAFADFIVDTDYSILGFASKSEFQDAWHKFLQDVYIDPIVTTYFKVDMSYYISQGLFNPATDKVYIGGPWSSWFPFVMTAEDDGVYTYRLACQLNKEYQYKFKVNTAGASNEGWENLTGGNRVVQTHSTDITLPIAAFNNQNPTLSIVSPNGGEAFIAGDSATISWKYTTVPTIKVEYSDNGGTSWSLISSSVQGEKMSMRWKVPSVRSSNMKIRISDTANGSISDVSDQPFSIVESNEIGGPFLPDEHTVALFHFDNNYENIVHKPSTGFANSNISFVSSFDVSHGSCVKIDNTNPGVFSNVEIPFYDQLSLSGSWTIDFWFNIKSWGSGTAEYPCVFIKTGANYFVFLNPERKTLYVGYDYEGGAEQIFLPDNSIEKNTWYHLTYIRNTATTELKCLLHDSNLQLVASASGKYTASHLPRTNNDPLRLGGFSWGSNLQFDGYADELRISNIAREFRSLVITAPNGGEKLTVGSRINILWTSNDIQKIKLEYTTNNGSSWSPIASNLTAASGSYSWTIPNTTSSTCKIRISDQDDASLSDESNQTFSIINEPVLALTKPAGGECWQTGSTQNITWNSEEIATCKLEYSTDNGETWYTISNSIPAATHSYSFVVPDIVAYEWKFRISDATNPSLTSISNGLIITYGELPQSVAPLMTVEYPVFNWPLNAYYPIANPIDNQEINGRIGNACGPTVVANALRYWEFPRKGTSNRTFTDALGCTWSADFENTEYKYDRMPKSIPFNATQQEYDEVATLMYHSGVAMHNYFRNGDRSGVIDAMKNYFNFSKKAKFLSRAEYTPEQWEKIVKSELSHKRPLIVEGWGSILPNGDHDGHWFFCDGYNADNLYHIRWDYGESSNEYCPLYEFGGYSAYNWIFVYLEPERNGKILELTTPSGNENWQQGTQKTLMWSSTNVNSIDVEFSANNGYDWETLASNVSTANGSYTFTVPANVSKNCKIRITDASNKNIYDRNTIPFSIYDVQELNFVQSFPAQLQSGCKIPLRWTSKGVQQVTIEYSTNSGSTWSKIADTLALAEIYLWEVPNIVSSTCMIRVSDKANNMLFSTSTAFSIGNEVRTGGPYSPDEKTVALFHFDNNYINEAIPSEDGIPYNTIDFEDNFNLGLDKCVKIDNSGSTTFSNIEIPHYNALSLRKDWKIELWFKIVSWGSETVEYPTLLLKPGANYHISPLPGRKSMMAGYDYNGGYEQIILPNNSVSLNKWYHVTFIRDTETSTLELTLVDNNLQQVAHVEKNFNPLNVPKTTNDPLRLGGFHMGSNFQFNGYVDELMISAKEEQAEELTVKFSVDLNYQIENGIFNPATDKVYLRGNFNNWGTDNQMEQTAETGVYTCTIALDPSLSYEYKYFINSAGAENNGWELNVGAGGNPNRALQTGTTPMELAKDYFNIIQVSVKEFQNVVSFVNYPNPFTNSTNIEFYLSGNYEVSLTVFDLFGRKISNIVSGELPAGSHKFKWETGNLPEGVYLCKLKAGVIEKTCKLILQKR